MSRDRYRSEDTDSRVQKLAEYWDGQAGFYDQEFDHTVGSEAEQVAWSRVFSIVTANRSRIDVLDVGTGTGFLALALASQGHRVTGIDLAPKMLAQARQKAADQGLSIRFEPGDAERPSFPDETFDLIISRHVFWSLSDPATTLNRWFRLLRPGGRLAILDGDWGPGATTDPGVPTPTTDEVRASVEAHGYVDVQVDSLADLSDALDARAEREGHSPARFERYLIWGSRPA